MSQNNKVVWINEQQTSAYLTAKTAIMRENGPDMTEGEIVEELAKSYTNDGETCDVPFYCSLVDETAAQNGDPVYSRDELEEFGVHELRNLAAEASTDHINGKSVKYEIFAYYNCPYPVEDNGSTKP